MSGSGQGSELAGLDSAEGVVPIVFIPGIMGTRLERVNPKTGLPEIVWSPDGVKDTGASVLRALAKKLDLQHTLRPATNMELDEDHEFHDAEQKIDGFCELVTASYGKAMAHLQSHFGSQVAVYGRGYDFRQSNADSAYKMHARLNRIWEHHGQEKMIIVAHSMGGFVARYGARNLGWQDMVRAMFLVGSPILGGPKGYRIVRRHEPIMEPELSLGWESHATMTPGLNLNLNVEGQVFQRVAPHMWSSYQLLPHARLRRPDGKPWLKFDREQTGKSLSKVEGAAQTFTSLDSPHLYDDMYTGVVRYGKAGLMTYHAENSADVSQQLDFVKAARNFSRNLGWRLPAKSGQSALPARVYMHPRTYLLAEGTLRTIVGCRARGDHLRPKTGVKRSNDGDKTVPLPSAQPRRADMYTVKSEKLTTKVGRVNVAVDGEHGVLVVADSTIKALVNRITRIREGDE